MALVTSQRIRKDIPHEPGEWIEFRPLKVAEAGGLTADADGGVVMLTRCIVGWSYDAPCDAENIATLDITLTAQELQEIDRWYTPCDVINDYNTTRIPRVPAPRTPSSSTSTTTGTPRSCS
jgi:hypothetical protein